MVTPNQIVKHFEVFFKGLTVKTILSAPDKFIIHTVVKGHNDSVDGVYYTKKSKLDVKEYPYLIKGKEYMQARNNVVYKQ